MHTGPDWWVKIADFGISKRVTEGLTAPSTRIFTFAFAAPEVLGLVQTGDGLRNSYANAGDVWSLGVITFLILTGETLFKHSYRLGQYVAGRFNFPLDVLHARKASTEGCEFVRSLMAIKPEDRPRMKECFQNPWLSCFMEASETQRYYLDETRKTVIF